MKQIYSEKQVYDAATRGFGALYTIVRNDVKGVWKELTREEKYKTARSLAHIYGVSKNPAKYLSRANTEAAWRARAKEFATERKLPDIKSAYYIVPSPVTIVTQGVENALSFRYGKDKWCGHYYRYWYKLADAFMHYDYDISSGDKYYSETHAQQYAAELMEISARLADRAKEINACGLKSAWLQFVHSFKNYEK